MHWLSPALLAIQVISSLSIIVLVLLQQGKGADMGSSFGGGSAGSLFGATGAANFLSRTTKWAAIIFFASTIGLAYLSHHPGSSSSILEGGLMKDFKPAPAPAAGTGPAVPAAPGTAPATPASQSPAISGSSVPSAPAPATSAAGSSAPAAPASKGAAVPASPSTTVPANPAPATPAEPAAVPAAGASAESK